MSKCGWRVDFVLFFLIFFRINHVADCSTVIINAQGVKLALKMLLNEKTDQSSLVSSDAIKRLFGEQTVRLFMVLIIPLLIIVNSVDPLSFLLIYIIFLYIEHCFIEKKTTALSAFEE